MAQGGVKCAAAPTCSMRTALVKPELHLIDLLARKRGMADGMLGVAGSSLLNTACTAHALAWLARPQTLKSPASAPGPRSPAAPPCSPPAGAHGGPPFPSSPPFFFWPALPLPPTLLLHPAAPPLLPAGAMRRLRLAVIQACALRFRQSITPSARCATTAVVSGTYECSDGWLPNELALLEQASVQGGPAPPESDASACCGGSSEEGCGGGCGDGLSTRQGAEQSVGPGRLPAFLWLKA